MWRVFQRNEWRIFILVSTYFSSCIFPLNFLDSNEKNGKNAFWIAYFYLSARYPRIGWCQKYFDFAKKKCVFIRSILKKAFADYSLSPSQPWFFPLVMAFSALLAALPDAPERSLWVIPPHAKLYISSHVVVASIVVAWSMLRKCPGSILSIQADVLSYYSSSMYHGSKATTIIDRILPIFPTKGFADAMATAASSQSTPQSTCSKQTRLSCSASLCKSIFQMGPDFHHFLNLQI